MNCNDRVVKAYIIQVTELKSLVHTLKLWQEFVSGKSKTCERIILLGLYHLFMDCSRMDYLYFKCS